MTKIKNNSPLINITSTNQIKYVGDIPTCALTGDCSVDETNLTYLISILLERYCLENDIIDADMSTIDISCILSANSDIELPETITVETLAQYYEEHLCSLYTKISELNATISNINGIICMNDIVTTEENISVVIDSLFNDVILGLSGTAVLTIITEPINGSATISSNSINYTPNEDFNGNDSIVYQITKGEYTCTGKIKINVSPVVSEETISDIVTEQLVTILQSNEYWDIGFPIGTKIAISGVNLVDFTLTGGSWGLGKIGTKWYKWAICNGNNSTEDHKQATLRGFDINHSDYDSSAEAGGSDTASLIAENVAPHVHTYIDGFVNCNDNSLYAKEVLESHADSLGVEYSYTEMIPFVDNGAGANQYGAYHDRNTGDGTDNLADVGEVAGTPFDVRNAYTTLVTIQKIS